MSEHVFHPPTALVSLVQNYAAGLAEHKADYTTPPESAPNDLKPLLAQAKALAPLAKKIADLEVEVAIARVKYNEKALPLWNAWAPKIAIARTYAKAKKLTALSQYLENFAHHAAHHEAAVKAKAPGVVAPPKS